MKLSVVSMCVVGAAALVITKQAPVAPAAPVAAGPVPMFNKDTMPPVSTTMKCIMNLASQYFLVYTALAIVRTLNQMYGGYKSAQNLIEIAAKTVVYAPMLSVLFLGTRMRAIQLSQGETEKYALPQDFVKTSMQVASWSVLAQVLLVLIVPLFTGSAEVPTDEEGNVDANAVKGLSKNSKIALNVAKYATLGSLYGGAISVVYGVYSMPAPEAIWGKAAPPVSPAVDATVNLTAQFFLIYFALACVRTYKEFYPKSDVKKLDSALQLASYTVAMAPMLCVLFIGARMRALQIDPKNGNPQAWAQNCFYMCAYSILDQTLLVLVLPFSAKGVTCEQGSYEGDVIVKGLTGYAAHIMSCVRYLAVLALYGGFTAIMYSIFTIQNPVAAVLTPPLSPALQCVMGLTLQFFTVYLVLFLAKTSEQFLGYGSKVASIAEQARGTVMYAPMLSVLFIGARMRALQLTKAQDGSIPVGAGPYGWMQDNMYYTVWAVFVQLVMVIVMASLYEVNMDADGNVQSAKGASPWVGHTINVLRYTSMAAMYGGSVAILYGLTAMTPETLPPYAAQAPLIPGVKAAGPPLPPTPGA